jgi:hypothetical protein
MHHAAGYPLAAHGARLAERRGRRRGAASSTWPVPHEPCQPSTGGEPASSRRGRPAWAGPSQV